MKGTQDKSYSGECCHQEVECINQYELIRKYRCRDCGAVMMCECDRAYGERFLPHQLGEGSKLETRERVEVTHGFHFAVCPECRGLSAVAAPMAQGFGRTSKIRRYYWREIYFAETERKADWDDAHPSATDSERADMHRLIEEEVLAAVKANHARSPKYDFSEPSDAEVLERHGVTIVALKAEYAESPLKGAVIALGNETISVEDFAIRYFEAQGWSAMRLESVPLHALFATMMWMLIEDPHDPKVRMVGYGCRKAFEEGRRGEVIWAFQPDDFGTPGYGARRRAAINRHLDKIVYDRDELLWLYDYWLNYSENLRQYLWAHRDADAERARKLIEILPGQHIRAILRYLIDDYWGHYLGWPDLLLWRGDDILLVEVKSSSDRLSGDQKRWIADNEAILKLPFQLVKVHRSHGRRGRSQQAGAGFPDSPE